MIDWNSPDVERICQDLYIRMASVFVGIYIYYYFTSLPRVEIPLVCRRSRFSFAHVPYLLGRCCGLASAIILLILLFENYSERCAQLTKLMPILSSIVNACSSTNLMLRPFAMFRKNKYIIAVLLIFMMGHWGIAIGGVISLTFVQLDLVALATDECAGRIPIGLRGDYRVILFYAYTLGWDLIITLFTVFGLFREVPSQASMWSTLSRQNLGYLIVSLALNVPMIVFTALNLNGTMDILFATPSGIVSVMVSSVFVVSLLRTKQLSTSKSGENIELGLIHSTAFRGDIGILTTHITLPTGYDADTSHYAIEEVPSPNSR